MTDLSDVVSLHAISEGAWRVSLDGSLTIRRRRHRPSRSRPSPTAPISNAAVIVQWRESLRRRSESQCRPWLARRKIVMVVGVRRVSRAVNEVGQPQLYTIQ